MIYWQIAFVFFLVSLCGCMYSMWVHEKDFNVFHGMLERAGICFVVSVAWPLSLIAIIAFVVSEFFLGENHE